MTAEVLAESAPSKTPIPLDMSIRVLEGGFSGIPLLSMRPDQRHVGVALDPYSNLPARSLRERSLRRAFTRLDPTTRPLAVFGINAMLTAVTEKAALDHLTLHPNTPVDELVAQLDKFSLHLPEGSGRRKLFDHGATLLLAAHATSEIALQGRPASVQGDVPRVVFQRELSDVTFTMVSTASTHLRRNPAVRNPAVLELSASSNEGRVRSASIAYKVERSGLGTTLRATTSADIGGPVAHRQRNGATSPEPDPMASLRSIAREILLQSRGRPRNF